VRWLNRFAVSIYKRLLLLYPADFRSTFADEMLIVFQLRLDETLPRGWITFLMLCLRESIDFPFSLFLAYRRKDSSMNWLRLRGENNVNRARNLTRAASLVVAFFLNWTFIEIARKPDYGIWSQSVPFVVTIFITNLLMLVAWRWERLGAWLTLIGALGVGLTIAYSMFVTASLQNVQIPAPLIVFIAAAWASPYILFGLLFLNFSRHKIASPIPV
jgi:hypothetical protein